MNAPLPSVRLKNAWNSTHPWIFQRLVDKPATRPKSGQIVDVVGVDGVWIGRGFYNGHSRIALRMLERDPDVDVDAAWFARKIAEAVQLREVEYPTHLQLGQYTQPVAFRKNVSGILAGPSIAFWNVEVK